MSEQQAKRCLTPWIAVIVVIIKVASVLLISAASIFGLLLYWELTTPQITDSTFYSWKIYGDSEAFDIEQLSLTFKKITLQQFQQSNGTNVIRCKNSHNYFEVTFYTTSKQGEELNHNVVCDNSIVHHNLYTFLTDLDDDGFYETIFQFFVSGKFHVEKINAYLSKNDIILDVAMTLSNTK